MPSIPLTQLQQLRQQVLALSPADGTAALTTTLSGVYSALQSSGFSYAGWAKGVVEQNSIAGISAMQFLTGTAMMGMGSIDGQSLTQTQIDKLKIDLADAYLRKLESIADSSSTVDRDIDAKEVWDIHKEGYQESGLPISSWTLDAVFEVFGKTFGEAELVAQRGQRHLLFELTS